jgi:alpha-glucosidase
MSLNLSLSGQPFNGPDIGGFAGDADPELFGHWIALGAFYPFSRAHTIKDSKDHEPWSFGEEVEEASRIALNRRYRLLPYIYTLFYEASQSGIPVMQPLFFADITDPELREEEQAFLLGKDLLIVPKWAKDPSLPKGKWRRISIAGENSASDPYQVDVLQREGSIIPLGNLIQTTDDFSPDSIQLIVSLNDDGFAEGILYMDKGDGFDYRKGDYLILKFQARLKNQALSVSISKSEGNLEIGKRKFLISFLTDTGQVTGNWSDKTIMEVARP